MKLKIKSPSRLKAAGLALLLGFISTPAHAQSFTIDWHKVAGGGGTSAGTNGASVYSLSGTVGQPDASATEMTGGNYSLAGGFWSFLSVVQTPGTPLLSLSFSGNRVIVSWPSSVTGWTLQTNLDLAVGTWGNYTGPTTSNQVTNSMAAGNLFFRLKQ